MKLTRFINIPMPQRSSKIRASASVPTESDAAEPVLQKYIQDFLQTNEAARVLDAGLKVLGVGLRPLIDHLVFWSQDLEGRAQEFIGLGFNEDPQIGLMESSDWQARVYRKTGYPSVLIYQAIQEDRGKGRMVARWVKQFGHEKPHHIAIQVDELENAIFFLEKQGVAFSDAVIGDKHSALRQVATKPQLVEGKAFTVVELVERRYGFQGFISSQVDSFLQSLPI